MNRGIHDITVPGGPIEITDSGGGPLTIDVEEKTLLFATGTAALSGNNTIIASPGVNLEIKIVALQIQNESLVNTTAIIYFGTTAKWRLVAKELGVGILLPIAPGHVWKVGVNTPLILNLNGANTFGYNVAYYVE